MYILIPSSVWICCRVDLVCDELGGRGIRGRFLARLARLLGWAAAASERRTEPPLLPPSPSPGHQGQNGHTRGMTPAFLLRLEFKVANFSDSVGADDLLVTLTLKGSCTCARRRTHVFMDLKLLCQLCPLSPTQRPLPVLTVKFTVHYCPEPYWDYSECRIRPACVLPLRSHGPGVRVTIVTRSVEASIQQ